MFVIFLSSNREHEDNSEAYGYWSGKLYKFGENYFPICNSEVCSQTKRYTTYNRAKNGANKALDKCWYVERYLVEDVGDN